MKQKLLFVISMLVAIGGFWLGQRVWRTHSRNNSSMEVVAKPQGSSADPTSTAASAPQAGPNSDSTSNPSRALMLNPPARLSPPEQNRRFTDFTPEQRVKFARQGHGPGG